MGQTKRADSLRKIAYNQSDLQTKQKALLLLNQDRSIHTDSLLVYAEQLHQIAGTSDNTEHRAIAAFAQLNYLLRKGLNDSALENIQKFESNFSKATVSLDLQLKVKRTKAYAYVRKNLQKDGMAVFFDILKQAEQAKDTANILVGLNGIGLCNMELEHYPEAKAYFQKVIAYKPFEQFAEIVGISTSNIGAICNNMNQWDSGYYFANEAINMCRKNEHLYSLCNALNIQASNLIYKKQNKEAGLLLEEALAVRKKIGDPFFVLSDMAQLSSYYASIGEWQKGIAVANEGIAEARQRNMLGKLEFLMQAKAENLKASSNSQAYSEHLEHLLQFKDSSYTQNSAQALSELQAKYDQQKADKTIIEQKYELNRKNTVIYGSLGALFLLTLIGFNYFRELRRRQQLNMAKALAQEKLLAQESVAKAKEVERNRIAAELHDNIGAQLSYISSNINFLLQPPKDLTPQEESRRLEKVNETARNSITDLRETIWALKKDEIGMEEFSDKLKAFVQQHKREHTQVQFQIEVSNEEKLPAHTALHLFRICQEAIHNAFKHSHATKLNISVQQAPKQALCIAIEDNGNGFDTQQKFEGHYGLENMQHRAAEIAARIQLSSTLGKGTKWLIEKSRD
jgi:two-component system, NarL family, sensor kinase